MNGRNTGRLVIGVAILVLGVLLLLGTLGVGVGKVFGILFAIIIIVLGLWILWRSTNRQRGMANEDAFAGTVHYATPGWKLKSGRYAVTFGELKMDLTSAAIDEGEHRLELDAFMGSIVVTLPRDVGASASGHALLGAVRILGQRAEGVDRTLEAATDGYATAPKRIAIRADVFAGDINIQYV